MSRASSKLRIEHLSFRRHTENKSAPVTPVSSTISTPTLTTPEAQPPPESPLELDWSERGAGDGVSNQQDSDFGTPYYIIYFKYIYVCICSIYIVRLNEHGIKY